MNQRVTRLREKLFAADDRAIFLERRVGLLRASERHTLQPPELRHAMTFAEILETMTPVVDADDLLVGRTLDVVPIDDEVRILEETNDITRPVYFSTAGHITPSWPTLLNKGMLGIKATAETGLSDLGAAGDAESQRKRRFWQAAIICCDAVCRFAERYAAACESLVLDASAGRAAELREVAAVLRQVPAGPARTFHEALQSVWFLDFLMHTVCGSRDYTPGRFDQYLYPYYAADLDAGSLTRERAKELVECFFLKTNEIIGLGDQANPTKRELHQDSVQYLVLGGQTRDGRDATNDLSFLCLEAADDLRLKQPTFTVRYHAGMDRRFWLAVVAAVREGINGIGIYNDGVTLPALRRCGVAPEDAWDISFVGCCHPSVPGKENQLREHQHNLAKQLELALNDGIDLLTGERVGPPTGDPTALTSFEDLLRAVKLQIEAGVERAGRELDAGWAARIAEAPFHFESLLVESCVEAARDVWVGAKYVHHIHHSGAIATAADSLAAIRGAVFEEGILSLAGLRDLLAASFEGNELLRLRLQNRYPRYGNDDDSVDLLARQLSAWFAEAVLRWPQGPAGRFWPQLYTYHRYKGMGKVTGATADGRRAGEPVSENQSATLGMDRGGPTAFLGSLAKLPFELTPAGGVTLTLHPSAFAGESGLAALDGLLETYFRRGGLHLQLNAVDRATLLAARERPADFRGLVVRVTGYSAYFVTLDAESQEQVIARAV